MATLAARDAGSLEGTQARCALVIIAEIYKGAATKTARLVEKYARRTGIKILSPDEHRELLANAGYSDIQIVTEASKGWICGIGKKPIA